MKNYQSYLYHNRGFYDRGNILLRGTSFERIFYVFVHQAQKRIIHLGISSYLDKFLSLVAIAYYISISAALVDVESLHTSNRIRKGESFHRR